MKRDDTNFTNLHEFARVVRTLQASRQQKGTTSPTLAKLSQPLLLKSFG